jgi:hypothetical protein
VLGGGPQRRFVEPHVEWAGFFVMLNQTPGRRDGLHERPSAFAQVMDQRLEPEPVAVRSEPRDHPNGNPRHIGVLSE